MKIMIGYHHLEIPTQGFFFVLVLYAFDGILGFRITQIAALLQTHMSQRSN